MRGSLLAAAALTVGLGMVPGTAAATPAPTATTTTPGADQSVPPVMIDGLGAGTHKVTLVTGDRVKLQGAGNGEFTVSVDHLAARPAGQAEPTIEVTGQDDGVYAIPQDVASAVAAGRVDRKLFDLKYLAEHGLTDEANGQLPLIVRYDKGNAFAAAAALPASDATRALESISGAAVSVPKVETEKFWSAVRDTAAVDRIWLDGMAEMSLDVSVPLIGAPQAWQSGVDGTGVKVAVLDSGADAGHPDLAGQIVASQSFIPGETVQDQHGHGTHVATTIAGTGAASGGKYKGVAPGAKLVIGKVCQLNGCPYSSMIEGMEWAAAQGVDVVSMSLGGSPTDGTDALSMAVNDLTASTGTLFVIAAGNEGPGAGTVSAPGTADAALTVAASSKTDTLASFSSRGPRLDGRLKPDIAAPGVQIVAGRASGTTMGTPVDDHYTSANGTSMATPHVSGSVALLAQRHPDWQAPQLKAALMSTSKDIGFTAYETGAGRVDVARAVSQQVFATTTAVDLGNVDPGQTPEPVTKEVGYTNTGDTPVTLTLARKLGRIGGDPVPGDAFTGDDTVTVPAHGTATARVTLDLAPLPVGRYSGAVTATDPASGTSLTVPVAMDRQAPKVELIIRLLDRNGQPPCAMCAFANAVAVDVPGTGFLHPTLIEEGVFQTWVEQGTYGVHGSIVYMEPGTSESARAVLFDPEVVVDGRTEVVLDARKAKEVTVRAPEKTTSFAQTITWSRSTKDKGLVTSVTIGGYHWGQNKLLVSPTERVATGKFHFGVARLLANPQVSVRVTGRDGFDLKLYQRGYSDKGQLVDGARAGAAAPWPAFQGRVELVDVGYGRTDDLAGKNLRGKLAVMRWGDDRFGADFGAPDGVPDSVVWTDRARALKDAGAIGYLAVSAPPEGWEQNGAFSVPSTFYASVPGGPELIELPEAQLTRDQGLKLLARMAKGRVSVDLTADPNVRETYQMYPNFDGGLPANLDVRVSDRQLVTIDTGYHGAEPYTLSSSYSMYNPGQGFGGGTYILSLGPGKRVDHYGPVNPAVRLMRSKDRSTDGIPWMSSVAYPKSGRTGERWFAPGTAPGTVNMGAAYAAADPNSSNTTYLCNMCREGNLLFPIWVKAYRDGTQMHGPMQAGGVRLYDASGAEILPKPASAFRLPAFELPAEAGDYRMTMQSAGRQTTWHFRSSAPTEYTAMPGGRCVLRQLDGGTDPCEQEPLVFLGYDLGRGLRLDNTVAAGGQHEFTLFAQHGRSMAAMPRISGAKVWTSTDDGATWQAARVSRAADGRFTVSARYPALAQTTGAVSIKAEAWDADGNRVEQRLDRVFQLAQR